MPQIYSRNEPRTRTLSSASSASTSTSLEPINADDSIGAMRIDHGSTTNAASGIPATTRNLVLVERPSWDSDFDFDLSAQPDVHFGRPTSMRHPRRRQRSRRYGPYSTGAAAEQQEDAAETVYTLVCGAETTAACGADEFEPFKPSVLPLYPPPQTAKAKDPAKWSTGCGAVVHTRAAPRPRLGVWSACGAAPESVVALDASYFDTREAAKMVRSKCGCINEGVGCAVCGNPLGTRHIPCKSASDSFFCPRNTEKARLRGPEGPQYWHLQASDHTTFTFFSDAVTSRPSYTFPTRARQRVLSNASDESLDVSHSSSDDEGDSFPFRGDWSSDLTSYSPPVSFYQQQVIGAWERERERQRENDRRRPRGGRGFDPDGASAVWGVVDPDGIDGETDVQEPGSPDKANEHFLFPER
ncbi:hypothetical protein BJ912DRAFT_970392 [Pholiota molesta]|nr:hypothetical protein BJ912DRAFT_970392 [Pholiota molesta]